MILPRRSLLAAGAAAPLGVGYAASLNAATPTPPAPLVPEVPATWSSYQATYRGTHFGTHAPVYYELVHRVSRQDGVLTSEGLETPDGDRPERQGPGARREVRLDDRTGSLIAERFSLGERGVIWEYAVDPDTQTVTGRIRTQDGPVPVRGSVSRPPLTYFAIDLILSRLPLAPGYEASFSFLSGRPDGTITETPVTLRCERTQTVHLGGVDLLGHRVTLQGPTENSYGMGLRIVLAREPRLVLRSFYQSEYRPGPPEFDSHGVDVLTSFGFT